jgi:hypothetical protein
MKRFTSHSNTPTTHSVITTVTSGILFSNHLHGPDLHIELFEQVDNVVLICLLLLGSFQLLRVQITEIAPALETMTVIVPLHFPGGYELHKSINLPYFRSRQGEKKQSFFFMYIVPK